MSDRIQIMRWRSRKPLAAYVDTGEPAGEVLDFTIRFIHGGLEIVGPADATQDGRHAARQEALRRYPGHVLR